MEPGRTAERTRLAISFAELPGLQSAGSTDQRTTRWPSAAAAPTSRGELLPPGGRNSRGCAPSRERTCSPSAISSVRSCGGSCANGGTSGWL